MADPLADALGQLRAAVEKVSGTTLRRPEDVATTRATGFSKTLAHLADQVHTLTRRVEALERAFPTNGSETSHDQTASPPPSAYAGHASGLDALLELDPRLGFPTLNGDPSPVAPQQKTKSPRASADDRATAQPHRHHTMDDRLLAIDLRSSVTQLVRAGSGRPLQDGAAVALQSFVLQETSDQWIVGTPAFRQWGRRAARTVFGLLRILSSAYTGHEPDDPVVKAMPFSVSSRMDGGIWLGLGTQLVGLEEALLQLLQGGSKLAHWSGGRDVPRLRECVVVVPASLSPLQRRLVRTACAKAGLNTQGFVSRTAAIALSHRLELDRRSVLICDWGTDFLEASVVFVRDESVHVRATSCRATGFAGFDIDLELADIIRAQHRSKKPTDAVPAMSLSLLI